MFCTLTPGGGQRLEERRRDARVRAHAGTDQRHLADVVVVEQRLEPDRDSHLAPAPAIAVAPSAARQREGDVGAAGRSPETFCTIMSMLTSASATARKIAAASPGLSGTPTTVIRASLTVVRDAGDDRLLHQFLLGYADDPGAVAVGERRTDMDRVRRSGGRTRRSAACRIFAPQAASSSISS